MALEVVSRESRRQTNSANPHVHILERNALDCVRFWSVSVRGGAFIQKCIHGSIDVAMRKRVRISHVSYRNVVTGCMLLAKRALRLFSETESLPHCILQNGNDSGFQASLTGHLAASAELVTTFAVRWIKIFLTPPSETP